MTSCMGATALEDGAGSHSLSSGLAERLLPGSLEQDVPLPHITNGYPGVDRWPELIQESAMAALAALKPRLCGHPWALLHPGHSPRVTMLCLLVSCHKSPRSPSRRGRSLVQPWGNVLYNPSRPPGRPHSAHQHPGYPPGCSQNLWAHPQSCLELHKAGEPGPRGRPGNQGHWGGPGA